jgi:sucrose-6-phosphate hydrolase SacC (GH32 family)
MGVAMRADTAFGETAGGLQAPFVIKKDDKYLMFYGDWNHICMAESYDGRIFKRVIINNSPALFGDSAETNTRDPMLINTRGQWYCYYTAHPGNDGAIYLRKSDDLRNWGESKIVSHGGSPGTGQLWMAECPHVIPYDGKYYLFRTYSYGKYENGVQVEEPKTNIYCSDDPENFGVNTDSLLVARLPVAAPEIIRHNGEWYIAALMPDLQGIRISRMKWVPEK